jgi:membrane-associated phospholipid phosphatase
LLLGDTLFLIVVLTVVTLVWKISFHGAAISAAATLVAVLGGTTIWTILMIILAILVGWSRVHLERHTFMQVLGESWVGIVIALAASAYLWPEWAKCS